MFRVLGLCLACVLLFPGHNADAYEIGGRWTGTLTDGGGIQRGDAVTLLWSVVPDGESYERSNNSELIDFMDDAWNVPTVDRVPNLQNRAWWSAMNEAYQQYSDVSGLTMIYTPEQTPSGVDTGEAGDLRIGGEIIDNNPGGVLADNVYPNGGDMRIDTSRNAQGEAVSHNNYTGLFNLIAHESGHGVGLGHSDIQGAESVMESGLQTHFVGLQFDDVYAFNRSYGDPFEKNGGNDSSRGSTNLGVYTTHGAISLGTHASDSAVAPGEGDWLGIDGATDQDWFKFNVTQSAVVDVTVTPQGPSYTTDEQGAFNAAAQSDLRFEVYDSNTSLVKTVNKAGLGESEYLRSLALLSAGDYYVRVLGNEDKNQFYQLDVEVALPELKVTVNRESGGVYVSGLTSAGVAIDGYTISSPSGGLDTSTGTWNSLASNGEPGWVETNNTSQTLIELQPSGEKHIDSSDLIYLGDFFRQVVTAPFGTQHEEDFEFKYTAPGLGTPEVKALVEFVGDTIKNNLVLTVDPATGEAILTNDSYTAIDLDGYIIESASGALSTEGWLSLDDQEILEWRESNPNSTLLSELEPNGTELSPFESLYLGSLFDPNGLQDLALTFLLSDAPEGWEGETPLDWEGIVEYQFSADFDQDGDVDGGDLADPISGWQARYGSDLKGADFLDWQRQYGNGLNSFPSSQAVPEPSTLTLVLVAFLAVGFRRTKD